LLSIEKLIRDKEMIWPELCRLVLQQRLELNLVDDDEPDFEETFGPAAPLIKSIMERL
jgi:hypothetical protein